jgi:Topoisomerase IB
MITSNGFNVSKRKLKGLLQNTEKSAEVINLVYVSDKDPGIERSRHGKNFIYTKNGKKITDKNDLLRIRNLVLPPAWENVWICSLSNGHLQATGYDVKKRKQYKYHSLWSEFRNQTKFYHTGIWKETAGHTREACKGYFKTRFAIRESIGRIGNDHAGNEYSCGQRCL